MPKLGNDLEQYMKWNEKNLGLKGGATDRWINDNVNHWAKPDAINCTHQFLANRKVAQNVDWNTI